MEKLKEELTDSIKNKFLVTVKTNDVSTLIAPLVIGNIDGEEYLMGYYVDSITWVANDQVGEQLLFKIQEIQDIKSYISEQDGFNITTDQKEIERQFDAGSVLVTYYSNVED